MLNNTGFDLWADGYDKSVGLSDENDRYPFAGYRAMMNALYQRVLAQSGHDVLDIGFGTGVLTSRLYEQGCQIYGQDFSARMIELAQAKMPDARLYQGDFSKGLVPELYDFLRALLPLLNQDGCLFIGDVAFRTREELEACRTAAGEDWDSDEIYFVYGELRPHFPTLTFESFSHCTALLTLRR